MTRASFLLAIALLGPPHRHYHTRHPRRGPSKPALWTAYCVDGTHSFAPKGHGTCSHHGGVREWINQPSN